MSSSFPKSSALVLSMSFIQREPLVNHPDKNSSFWCNSFEGKEHHRPMNLGVLFFCALKSDLSVFHSAFKKVLRWQDTSFTFYWPLMLYRLNPLKKSLDFSDLGRKLWRLSLSFMRVKSTSKAEPAKKNFCFSTKQYVSPFLMGKCRFLFPFKLLLIFPTRRRCEFTLCEPFRHRLTLALKKYLYFSMTTRRSYA